MSSTTDERIAAFQSANDPDERLALAEQWCADDPQHGTAWFFLGEAYRDRNETAKALAAYLESDRLFPDQVATLGRIGDALMAQGDFEAAAQSFGQIIDGSDSPPFWALVGFANAAESLGNAGAALGALGRAVVLEPSDDQLAGRIVGNFERVPWPQKAEHAETVVPYLRQLVADDQASARHRYLLALARGLLGAPLFEYQAIQWELEGFVSEREIGGWCCDARDESLRHTIEVLEMGAVIGEAPTAPAAEHTLAGTFRFTLPEPLLDGGVHELTFRIKELGRELETLAVLAPERSSLGQKPGWSPIEDAPWARDLPARKARIAAARAAKTRAERVAAEVRKLEEAAAKSTEPRLERDYRSHCAIAELLGREADYEPALARYRSAMALDPELERSDAYLGYVETLHAAGREADALAFVHECLATHQQELERAKIAPALATLLELRAGMLARRRATKADLIAFYLPQFHPIPENDEWWGRGFTEWSNVTAARPLFPGHLQPRRPTALGFYDLRLPEAANAQFALARRYGIDAFCYYYYWFEGRRVLERPLNDLVEGRSGPFPFCICWANEDWTRSWDGLTGEVLLAQNHTPESDRQFMVELIPLLGHRDYYRYEGKPLVMVYRADRLATPKQTAAEWRALCREAGVGEIYLCAAQSFGFDDPRPCGFDAAVEFPPHSAWNKHPDLSFYQEIPAPEGLVPRFSGKLYSYQAFSDAAMHRPTEPYPLHRACFLAWDNTPRRDKTAHVYHGFSVNKYFAWLAHAAARSATDNGHGLAFVNAWNEWAEGTALEPGNHFGFEALEATRRARRLVPYQANPTFWRSAAPEFPADRLEPENCVLLVGHDAIFNGAQINLLNMARCLKREMKIGVAIFLLEDGPLLPEYERVGPTIVLGQGESAGAQLKSWACHYRGFGATKAICNTVITAEMIDALHEAGLKVVNLVHELPALIESYKLQSQCWQAADRADALVFASSVVADQFCDRYWPDRRKVVISPQGIVRNPHEGQRAKLREKVRRELGFPARASIVMGCGYGDTRKGIDLFVRLADRVRQIVSGPVGFVWVGRIEEALEPYVRADIERLGLEHDLIVTGTTDDPWRYYIASDAYALTSREDPFPSVVMEAFEAHLPVVGFDGAGGFVDIVTDETGGLVPYLDVEAMAQRLCALLDDEPLRARMGQHCHELCRARFGYAEYLGKILSLLDGRAPADVVAEPSPPARVSVIVPNFDYGRYLELRLRTILDQTLRPHEIIVLDDASTDYSLAVIESVASTTDVPIQLVRDEINSGNPFVQWAKGLAKASGDLIWIAEADDYCEPTFLERLARELVDENVVMAWCDSVMVDCRGQSRGEEYKQYHSRLHGETWHHSFRTAGTQLLRDCLLFNNVVPNASAVLFRRSAVPADLSLIQNYRFSGDWWFWISLAESGEVAYVATALNYHRRHGASVMGDVLRDGEVLLLETMKFFQRLAVHKASVIEAEPARGMLERVHSLYESFPGLVRMADHVADHPTLAAAYERLRAALEPVVAQPTSELKARATLLLSQDALEEPAPVEPIIGALAGKYRLSLVLIGDEAAAKAAHLEAQGLYEGVRWLLPRQRTSGAPEEAPTTEGISAESVDQADLASTAAHAISACGTELLLIVGLTALWAATESEACADVPWEVVAGKEWDALLGKLPLAPCSTAHLRRALGRARTLWFTGETVPHAAGRMAEGQRLSMKRLGPGKIPTAPDKEKVRYRGYGPAATVQEWQAEVARIAALHEQDGAEWEIEILAWGERLRELTRLAVTQENVKVGATFRADPQYGTTRPASPFPRQLARLAVREDATEQD